jgi:hypothetical protein
MEKPNKIGCVFNRMNQVHAGTHAHRRAGRWRPPSHRKSKSSTFNFAREAGGPARYRGIGASAESKPGGVLGWMLVKTDEWRTFLRLMRCYVLSLSPSATNKALEPVFSKPCNRMDSEGYCLRRWEVRFFRYGR